MIKYGANLDVKCRGQGPLHLALCHGKLSIIMLLLKHGASLKTRNQDGLTPLEFALKLNVSLKLQKALFYSEIM